MWVDLTQSDEGWDRTKSWPCPEWGGSSCLPACELEHGVFFCSGTRIETSVFPGSLASWPLAWSSTTGCPGSQALRDGLELEPMGSYGSQFDDSHPAGLETCLPLWSHEPSVYTTSLYLYFDLHTQTSLLVCWLCFSGQPWIHTLFLSFHTTYPSILSLPVYLCLFTGLWTLGGRDQFPLFLVISSESNDTT